MTAVNSEFVVPCTSDKAVIAIQDVIDSLGWRVLEMGSSLIVFESPGLRPLHTSNLPKISIQIFDMTYETKISVTVSMVGPRYLVAPPKPLVGIMGQVVNSISLRTQTNSVAINPTVSIGEGQGGTGTPANSRIDHLERLQQLLQNGILSKEEFEVEKKRIIN